jgi:hypothetical protein
VTRPRGYAESTAACGAPSGEANRIASASASRAGSASRQRRHLLRREQLHVRATAAARRALICLSTRSPAATHTACCFLSAATTAGRTGPTAAAASALAGLPPRVDLGGCSDDPVATAINVTPYDLTSKGRLYHMASGSVLTRRLRHAIEDCDAIQ